MNISIYKFITSLYLDITSMGNTGNAVGNMVNEKFTGRTNEAKFLGVTAGQSHNAKFILSM